MVLKALLLFLFSFAIHAQVFTPDQVIGDVEWYEARNLPEGDKLKEIAKLVGRLSTTFSVCTGWVNSDGNVMTAHHCLEKSSYARLRFPLIDETEYAVTKWLCNVGVDVCESLGEWQDPQSDSAEHTGKREAFVIHFQKGQVLISHSCEYWQSPTVVWQWRHDCDTLPGSSGGMLLDAEALVPVGVHTGGGLWGEYNLASKL